MLSAQISGVDVHCRCSAGGDAQAKNWSNESKVLTKFRLTICFEQRQRQLQTERSPPAGTVEVADCAERACEQVTQTADATVPLAACVGSAAAAYSRASFILCRQQRKKHS